MRYIALFLITFTSAVAFGAEVPQVLSGLLGPLTGLWLGFTTILWVGTLILGIACALGFLVTPMTRNKWDDQLVMDCSKWYLRLAEWLPTFGKTKRVKMLEDMVQKQMARANRLEGELKKGKKK